MQAIDRVLRIGERRLHLLSTDAVRTRPTGERTGLDELRVRRAALGRMDVSRATE